MNNFTTSFLLGFCIKVFYIKPIKYRFYQEGRKTGHSIALAESLSWHTISHTHWKLWPEWSYCVPINGRQITRSSKERAIFLKPGCIFCFSRNLCSNRNMMNARKKKACWFQLIATLMFWGSINLSGLICNLWDLGCLFS